MYVIGPGEATNLFFRVLPLEEKDSATKVNQTYTLSKDHHPPCQAPYLDFLKREKAYIAEKKKAEHLHGSAAPTNALDLILLWSTVGEDSTILSGQQNICGISLTAATAVDKPLRFRLESPRKVQHDFSQSR